MAWKLWVYYINSEFLRKMKWVLLEIKLPKEIHRSPLAMELALASFHQTGGTSQWSDKYWKGQVRNYFSLEIVSIGGNIHFFIRAQSRFRNGVESYIYAQYPEAEIVEVSDYVTRVSYAKNGRWAMWGNEFGRLKPNPYPIKTYVDYDLGKMDKEKEKVYRITPVVELMGSIKKGEQLWFQIIIRATESERRKAAGEKEVEKIKAKKLKGAGVKKFNGEMLTKEEKDVIAAIRRNTTKAGFDAGIRVIYIAEKEVFDSSNISFVMNILKQYNTSDLNGFWHKRITAADYPWRNFIGDVRREKDESPPARTRGQVILRTIPRGLPRGTFIDLSRPFISFTGDIIEKKKMNIFNLYRKRAFYKQNNRVPLTFSAEELATIYHFPGGVSTTPSFARIETRKSEPPANLPV
ncbi:MAG: hypothetical protein AAB471_00335 [Patescibacteria group bacterium]